MSTIIRATDKNRGIQCEAFNLGDMSIQADKYTEKIRAEAGKIVAQARKDAEAVRENARREGHEAAMREIEDFVRKELSTVLPALRQVIQDIKHAKQAWLTHWEGSAVHAAGAIASRLIRRELPEHPEIPLTLVREALQLAAGSAQLQIHLNVDDHKALGGQIQMLVDELAGLAEAELIPDPEITAGGCRVETEFGVIDQQFEAQLDRIEEELS